MICPSCGGEVERVSGAIEQRVIVARGGARIERRVRPATFYACGACEWCSEEPPPPEPVRRRP